MSDVYLQFKNNFEWQNFLGNFSWKFYLLSEFLPEICWAQVAEEITLIFRFVWHVWPRVCTVALLYHGGFDYLIELLIIYLISQFDQLLIKNILLVLETLFRNTTEIAQVVFFTKFWSPCWKKIISRKTHLTWARLDTLYYLEFFVFCSYRLRDFHLNLYLYKIRKYTTYIHYIYTYTLQPFGQDYDLLRLLCALQSTPDDRFLKSFFMAILFTLKVLYFRFDIWPGIWTRKHTNSL